MERLTYDFCVGGVHCWQVHGADNDLCEDVCKSKQENGCEGCPIGKAFDRLAAYEDTGLEPEEITEFMKRWKRSVEIAELCKMGGIDHLLELKKAEKDGKFVNYLPGDTVYDRFGMEWTVTTPEIHKFDNGTLRYLYRCGHPGTDDYCALYSDEILTREEAEAALSKNNIAPCKHGIGRHTNELGEDEIFCELTGRWMNVALGDCLGNCEAEEALEGGKDHGI